MVHRRKNAHPVCKTRRNLDMTPWSQLDMPNITTESATQHTRSEENIMTIGDEEPEYEYEIPEILPEFDTINAVKEDGITKHYPDIAGADTSKYPDIARTDTSTYPDIARTDTSKYPDMARTDTSKYPGIARADTSKYPSNSPSLLQTDAQQIMIPEDLFQDFEAVRSKTKMDTTDLMRRLLKDYQSLSQPQETCELKKNENRGNESTSNEKVVSRDYSLSPYTMDTHVTADTSSSRNGVGLDLTVKQKKQTDNYRENVSVSAMAETADRRQTEVPLDLSVTYINGDKVHTDKRELHTPGNENDGQGIQSRLISAVPMNLMPFQNGEACMYVYPVCYTGSELGGAIPPPAFSGVVVPGQTETAFNDNTTASKPLPDIGLINPDLSFGSVAGLSSVSLPPLYSSPVCSPTATSSQQDADIPSTKKELPTYFRMSSAKRKKSSRDTTQTSVKGSKPKEETEMKLISENTSYPGVYTSVLKLPWSRRTRTKKVNKKSQQEKDRIQPQQQLPQELPQSSVLFRMSENTIIPSHQSVLPEPTASSVSLDSPSSEPILSQLNIQDGILSGQSQNQSVMMVYPNNAFTTLGKPVRKRGRPPKLPMLAKLLQQSNKKSRKVNENIANSTVQTQITQQAQLNGGMILYNSSGQVLNTIGGFPMQQIPVSAEQAQMHGESILGPHTQFIGQLQLPTQFTSGHFQLAPQFQSQLGSLESIAQDPNPRCDGQEASFQAGARDQNSSASSNNVYIPPTLNPVLCQTSTITSTSGVEGTLPTDKPRTDVSKTNPETAEPLSTDNTHIITNTEPNTISTMSTTSIANTGSGSIYQEMILSSKTLVDIKPRKRQTAIQLLKSKSSDQNFLCTSFRIRPRLVAQAQAQRERLAAKCMKNIADAEERKLQENNIYCSRTNEIVQGCDINASSPLSGFESGSKGKRKRVPPLKIKIKQEAVDFNNTPEKQSDSMLFDCMSIKSELAEHQESVTDERECIDRYSNSANRFVDDSTSDPEMPFHHKTAHHLSEDLYHELGSVSDNLSCESPLAKDRDSSFEDSSVSMESLFEESISQDMFHALYHCKICNEVVPVDEKLKHWRKHVPVKYVCTTCMTEYSHVMGTTEQDDTQDFSFECGTCQSVVTKNDIRIDSSSSSSSNNMQFKPDMAIFNCEDSGSFQKSHEYQLQGCKDNSKTMAQYMCNLCNKEFLNYRTLLTHRKSHREKTIECPTKECKKKFNSLTNMEKHVLSRHSDKKQYYHCIYDGCLKKFLKNFHLQEHIRVKHFNIKAFQCPWPDCQKEFAAERHMKVHLLIHRDEKPLKCDYCEYRCRQRSAMNWHMRKHPEVPYKYKRHVNSPTNSAPESE